MLSEPVTRQGGSRLQSVFDQLLTPLIPALIRMKRADKMEIVYRIKRNEHVHNVVASAHRMHRDGAEGVASGFELLSAMIDRFGTDLLPARAETRKAALEWLAGATFAERLDRVQGLTGDVLERALSAVALITESTATWSDNARPQLSALYRRFEGRAESPKATDHPALMASPSASSAASLQAATEVSSSRDLLDRARQMAIDSREQAFGHDVVRASAAFCDCP